MNVSPICNYCNKFSVLVSGDVIYPNRPDLHSLKFWLCKACDAFVGCHRPGVGFGDGTRPYGSLANAALREARKRAHLAFDKLWETKPERRAAYAWLADQLSIHVDNCHIAMFDEACCKIVEQLSRKYAFESGKKLCAA